MEKGILISVVLPCYNERQNIISLIQEIHEILNPYRFEVIVVDDNSPDGTYQAVIDLKNSHVKAVLRTEDPSFAKSIRRGIEESQGKIIVVMDSDFNHAPKYLPLLIENLKYFDVVSGSRFVYGGKMTPRSRHLFSWIFNIFIRILTRKFVTDSLFGYFAIHRSVISQINFDKVFWGYGDYGIRLMYYLQEKKFTILQIPMTLGERKNGEGNKKFFKTFFQYLFATVQLVFSQMKVF